MSASRNHVHTHTPYRLCPQTRITILLLCLSLIRYLDTVFCRRCVTHRCICAFWFFGSNTTRRIVSVRCFVFCKVDMGHPIFMEFKLELIESDKNVRWHNLLHSYTSNWGLQWNWNEEENMSSSVESRLNLNVYATLNSHCLQLKYYNICNAITFNSHRTLQIAHITENKDTVPAVGDREKLLIIWLHQNYDNSFIGRNKNQIVVCDVIWTR